MTRKENVRVISTINIPDGWQERLRRVSPSLQLSIFPVSKPEEIPAEAWSAGEVLFTYSVIPQPALAPNLKWVQVRRPSLEHILEAPLLKREDIRFSSISGACAPPAAEYIMMSMLSIGHQHPENFASQKKGEWDIKRWRQSRPLELQGSTVGIVGYGSVGRELARILQPYHVTILATKLNAMDPEDRGYTIEDHGDPEGQFFHRLYPPQALRSMLANCDFVVVTVPLTARTQGLLSKEILDALKPGAVLVSVSDSQVTPLDALSAAVTEKKLRGAALDGFEVAPPSPEHPVWKLPSVAITPRIAWRSEGSLEQVMQFFELNLQRYLDGAGLLNHFDPERGY